MSLIQDAIPTQLPAGVLPTRPICDRMLEIVIVLACSMSVQDRELWLQDSITGQRNKNPAGAMTHLRGRAG